MYKKRFNKIFYNFLKTDYPENLIPKKRWTKKQKKIVFTKKVKITLKKRIQKAEDIILNKNSFTPLKTTKRYYLYPLEQIKHELFKRGKDYKSSSHFLHVLKERKKLSLLYGGLSNRFFRKIYSQAINIQGKFTQNLILLLEKRLDVTLYRICFFNSIPSARQAISHNLILVNGKTVNISSYCVKAGDVITINEKHFNILKNKIYKNIQNKIFIRKSRFILSPGLLANYLKSFKKDKKSLLYFLQNNTQSTLQLDLLNNLSKIEKCCLYRNIEKWNYSEKQKYKYCLYKEHLSKHRSHRQTLIGMRYSAMKPIHVEVSYKVLTAIILFSPLKVSFPALLDLELIKRSFR